ncbi:LysM peptidoglycan-binding domain-containing protein, partial [Streptococcus anginosus]|uniref:LysM peptidoglycan-binding domain-containing protein n=2 Tax=Streptococcus TaxID=1301 RepID=UPI0005B36A40
MILNLKNTNKKTKVGLISLAATALFFLPTLANADSYTVKSGDTLSAIAASHNTTVDQIAQKNKLSNIHLISVGQVLELDDTATSPTTAESSNSATTTSGLSNEDAAAKEWIAQKESSGSYTAQNGQYYGRYQLSLSY